MTKGSIKVVHLSSDAIICDGHSKCEVVLNWNWLLIFGWPVSLNILNVFLCQFTAFESIFFLFPSAKESDIHKLWKNIEPHLHRAMQTVYLREVSRSVNAVWFLKSAHSWDCVWAVCHQSLTVCVFGFTAISVQWEQQQMDEKEATTLRGTQTDTHTLHVQTGQQRPQSCPHRPSAGIAQGCKTLSSGLTAKISTCIYPLTTH